MPLSLGERGSIYVEPTEEARQLVEDLRVDLPRSIERGIKRDLRLAGRVVAQRARQLLRLKKGNRYRTRGGKRARNSGVSSPGEPPAQQRGDLARSIKYRASKSGLHVAVFTGKGGAHGRIFEFAKNTPRITSKGLNRGPLARRPFLTRALDENQLVVAAIIKGALDRAIELRG